MGNTCLGLNPDLYLNEDERMERRAQRARPIPIPTTKFKPFEPDEKIPGKGWRTMNILSNGLALDIKIIHQLHSLFVMADLDKGNTIDAYEFLRFLVIEDTPFNRKLFQLFDVDGGGDIDFLEFACAIWNICTWPEADLSTLMFYLYDDDRSGTMDLEECERMVVDIFYSRKDKTEERLLLESLRDIAKAGIYAHEVEISLPDFVEWAQVHHEVYHPLKCMYILIRNKILGKDYWDQIGVRARVRTMETLIEMIKRSLGAPGATDAVQRALQRTEKDRERELQRLQMEAMWGNEDDLLDGETEKVPGLPKSLKETQERVKTIQYLREERLKRFNEWNHTMKQIEGRDDPLSVMLRFTYRSLTTELREHFEKEWSTAMINMQGRIYDRDRRLELLLQNQPSKVDAYFTRKEPRELDIKERSNLKIPYSSAVGKQTWLEHTIQRKRDVKRAIRKAGGNKHLAKKHDSDDDSGSYFSLSSDDELDEDEEKRREQQEYAAGYCNAPKTSRDLAKPGQYKMQNLKRSTPEWRAKVIHRLKQQRDGIFDPLYRPPKSGYRKSKRIYAID